MIYQDVDHPKTKHYRKGLMLQKQTTTTVGSLCAFAPRQSI